MRCRNQDKESCHSRLTGVHASLLYILWFACSTSYVTLLFTLALWPRLRSTHLIWVWELKGNMFWNLLFHTHTPFLYKMPLSRFLGFFLTLISWPSAKRNWTFKCLHDDWACGKWLIDNRFPGHFIWCMLSWHTPPKWSACYVCLGPLCSFPRGEIRGRAEVVTRPNWLQTQSLGGMRCN